MKNPALMLSSEHRKIADSILRGKGDIWEPHVTLSPEGFPYLYRWYLVGGSSTLGEVSPGACVMFHIQVASDPKRPLHDHPWDNQSVILAGSYVELLQSLPPYGEVVHQVRKTGDVITRAASEAHRLIMPDDVAYTMTIFSAGPKVREWGFWFGDEWHHNQRHVATKNGISIHINEGDE